MSAAILPTTKPYFIRALHEWCCDHGYTPYLTVMVDAATVVPNEFVKDGEITLNVGPEATGSLTIDNESIHFSARFNGIVRDIWLPMGRIASIYARENGVGMGFDVVESPIEPDDSKTPARTEKSRQKEKETAPVKRPSHLQRVK